MKQTFLLIILLLTVALARHSFAESPKTINSDFIRPYNPPKEMAFLHDTLESLYRKNGVTRHEFEYSLPVRTELMVRVIFSRHRLVDRSASGTFYLSPPTGYLRNDGSFLIDRKYSTCKCPQEHNNWHVYFSIGKADYGYSFPEGTPNNYQHSSSEQVNVIIGKATKHENIIFAQEDKKNNFSMIVRVKCVPMIRHTTHNPNGSVIREPFVA